MIQQTHFAQRIDSPLLPTSCQLKALRLLNDAWLAARSEGQDIWQFAVEIEQLRALGLSHTDLRCLLCWDYLQHAQERTTSGTSQRIFKLLNTLVLPKRTCFVLTEKGRKITSESPLLSAFGERASLAEPTIPVHSAPVAPRWDGEACQLWWGNHLIKGFHRPAINQALVLAALEEEGWPRRIDDPLPPTGGIDPKIRLHDTIKGLNRHHHLSILIFRGDGSGRGVVWTKVEDQDMFPRSSPDRPRITP